MLNKLINNNYIVNNLAKLYLLMNFINLFLNINKRTYLITQYPRKLRCNLPSIFYLLRQFISIFDILLEFLLSFLITFIVLKLNNF